MHVVLVANGPFEDIPQERLRLAASEASALIGVDGGTHALLRLELTPTYVTGDFDSLTIAEREELAGQGVAIVPTPDQDYTDLDKALMFAFDTLGATSAHIYGGTGGRLDHLYSVLSTLIKHGRSREIRLIDTVGETFYVQGAMELVGEDLPGRTLSLLALGLVEGIITTGVQWPLNSEFLEPGVRDGTLNKVTAETVTISCTKGDLLVLLHHPGVSL
ncbi:MAG: thiamine diphosphokinase [Armatimonas sp.]